MESNNLFDLTGKVAVVTGASRGIGRSIALLLADYGAHVLVSSRKIEGCEAVANEIIDRGGKAMAYACHIGELDQIKALWDFVDKELGRVDILVNNAATNPHFGHVFDTDVAVFQKTVDVNIRGYFYMSIEGGKRMRNQGGGAIVNTASINAIQPGMHSSIYSITKAALVNMTKSFAKECGQFNIRCNAILPGMTKTKFASALFDNEDIYQSFLERTPLGRHAEPDDMAGTVLYLVSDASSYTTGECIVVDGGVTL